MKSCRQSSFCLIAHWYMYMYTHNEDHVQWLLFCAMIIAVILWRIELTSQCSWYHLYEKIVRIE